MLSIKFCYSQCSYRDATDNNHAASHERHLHGYIAMIIGILSSQQLFTSIYFFMMYYVFFPNQIDLHV